LISSENWKVYDPVRQTGSLILDGQTLENLEIFTASVEGGSLFDLLNHCVTPFGKRLFKQWICHPLQDVNSINARLDVIDELDKMGHMNDLVTMLSKLPDLERVISRIHVKNCKVKDFMAVLSAFRQIEELFEAKDVSISSPELSALLGTQMDEELIELLDYFNDAIKEKDAKMVGEMIPVMSGFDEEHDVAASNLANVEKELEAERKAASKVASCQVVFKHMGKELYQMEVPAKTKIPKDWTQMSKTVQV
jgi:DNA mismatch repair protein MSH6